MVRDELRKCINEPYGQKSRLFGVLEKGKNNYITINVMLILMTVNVNDDYDYDPE
jgi:hypothetical protein